jgi:hypothetical protein
LNFSRKLIKTAPASLRISLARVQAWAVAVAEDAVAGVVVAVLLLAMFVVAEVGAASPVVADMAAEVEASVADLVVMVVVHLHMEVELHPMAAEDMAEAMVTQAAPRMVHPPGGKIGDADTTPLNASRTPFSFKPHSGALRQRLQIRQAHAANGVSSISTRGYDTTPLLQFLILGTA